MSCLYSPSILYAQARQRTISVFKQLSTAEGTMSKVHGIEIGRVMRLTLGCWWAGNSEAMVVDDNENIVHVGIYFLKSDQLCLIKINVKL